MFARKGPHPDALFVTNDYMAIRVMDVLRFEFGLSIPDDIGIVGFDDVAMAALPTYDLTTVRQPVAQMVATTVRILFEQIDRGSGEPEHVILGARLIERGSTRR
jgi:DNA-binding LacI/PurR family transcriptional regulator